MWGRLFGGGSLRGFDPFAFDEAAFLDIRSEGDLGDDYFVWFGGVIVVEVREGFAALEHEF
jgi:hypothetical protein